jgi:hypothetical protein
MPTYFLTAFWKILKFFIFVDFFKNIMKIFPKSRQKFVFSSLFNLRMPTDKMVARISFPNYRQNFQPVSAI